MQPVWGGRSAQPSWLRNLTSLLLNVGQSCGNLEQLVTSKVRISCWVRSLDAAHLVRSPCKLEMEISIIFWMSSHWCSAAIAAPPPPLSTLGCSSLSTIFPPLADTLSIPQHWVRSWSQTVELKETICGSGRSGDLWWKLAYIKCPRACYLGKVRSQKWVFFLVFVFLGKNKVIWANPRVQIQKSSLKWQSAWSRGGRTLSPRPLSGWGFHRLSSVGNIVGCGAIWEMKSFTIPSPQPPPHPLVYVCHALHFCNNFTFLSSLCSFVW